MPEKDVSKIPPRVGGGPLGLGDPEDRFLRKVEIEVLIPQKMRDKAKAEKCIDEVKMFTECCAGSSLAMVFKCRKENNALKTCLTQWYDDEGFRNICKEEYIKERSEFRRTGVKQNSRRLGASM